MKIGKYPLLLKILLVFLVPILGMVLGIATMFLFGLNRFHLLVQYNVDTKAPISIKMFGVTLSLVLTGERPRR